MRANIDFNKKVIHITKNELVENATIVLHKILGDQISNFEFSNSNILIDSKSLIVSNEEDLYKLDTELKTIELQKDIDQKTKYLLFKYFGDRIENYTIKNRNVFTDVKLPSIDIPNNSGLKFTNLISAKFCVPTSLCHPDFNIKSSYIKDIKLQNDRNVYNKTIIFNVMKPVQIAVTGIDNPFEGMHSYKEIYRRELLYYNLIKDWNNLKSRLPKEKIMGSIEFEYMDNSKDSKKIIFENCYPNQFAYYSNNEYYIQIGFNYTHTTWK